ncbi:hypothetical protein J2Y67_003726 [Neobacillus niacini]|nr:hypothetical protein [Neobacillus niacini]
MANLDTLYLIDQKEGVFVKLKNGCIKKDALK